MHTLEYLDAVKVKLGITSDYALAKALNVGQPNISAYRAGRRIIDDDMALTIATALGISPLEVIAAANVERAKTPEMKEKWLGLLAGFRTLLSQAKFDGVERRRSFRFALPH